MYVCKESSIILLFAIEFAEFGSHDTRDEVAEERRRYLFVRRNSRE